MSDRQTELASSPTSQPYISIVVTARNDDHGGNLLGRMQAFVDNWLGQARRFGIRSELIVAEWNPPPDRPRLSEVLRFPETSGFCPVRFIEVPTDIHRRYRHADALPLYQMIGKNVGIRRARGDFVLATNIDILFSDELAAFLAAEELQPGRMYRIDRYDVMDGVPAGRSPEEQIAYCRTHLIRINAREGTFNVTPDGRRTVHPVDVTDAESGIVPGQGWLAPERIMGEVFRWAGQYAELIVSRAPQPGAALTVDLDPGPGTAGAPLDLEIVDDSNMVRARILLDRRSQLSLAVPVVPTKLRFRVFGGGRVLSDDPRILNFRALYIGWQPGSLKDSPASVRPQSLGARVSAAWRAIQHVIHRLATGGPLVTLTIPVSPAVRRILRAYVERRGLTGALRDGIKTVFRSPDLRLEGAEVVDTASGITPGSGWGIMNEYAGRRFRDVRDGAELIVDPAGAAEISFHVDIAPGTISPVAMSLLDSDGQCVAERRVTGYESIAFPLAANNCTRVFTLQLRAAEGPAGLRVFRCVWASTLEVERNPLPRPWGHGWSLDNATDGLRASARAELILRTPPRRRQSLLLEVEPGSPAVFELRDSGGRTLHQFSSRGRVTQRLDLELPPDRTHVLFLSATFPFRGYRCEWDDRESTCAGSLDVATAPFLHTNACGDFTLLARERWFDLRGYPEFDLFSMNLDSVFCFTAHHGGAREEVLTEPMRIYHIEHSTGSGWTPEGQVRLFERLAARGLSFVDNADVLRWAAQMSKLNAPMIFNLEDWGLAGIELPEIVVMPAGSGK